MVESIYAVAASIVVLGFLYVLIKLINDDDI